MIRVLLSGGMDSAACLAWAMLEHGRNVDAVFFTYGQRHEENERRAMGRLCRVYGINRWFVPLGRIAGSTLTAEHGDLTGSGVVVPNRNEIMLRQAAAQFPPPSALVMGSCLDDRAMFEDCRPAFFERMRAALRPCDVLTPLADLDKRGVYRFAERYGGSALLDLTWSCYAGGATPCGDCGACFARARAVPPLGPDAPP